MRYIGFVTAKTALIEFQRSDYEDREDCIPMARVKCIEEFPNAYLLNTKFVDTFDGRIIVAVEFINKSEAR